MTISMGFCGKTKSNSSISKTQHIWCLKDLNVSTCFVKNNKQSCGGPWFRPPRSPSQGQPESSRASENSPSSIPSPTYQWTKARLAYIRSNLWSMRAHLGDGRGVGQHAHGALHLGQVASGHNGGWLVVDTALEASGAPVDELDGALGLDHRTAALTSLGTTSPRYIRQQAMYLPWRGSHLAIMVGGLEHGVGDLGTDSCSW
jgi:hypothetical protein